MTPESLLLGFLFAVSVIAIGYFLLVNGTYITITAIAVRYLSRHRHRERYEPVGDLRSNQFLPGIAVIVPAYNEEPVIVDSVRALLNLEYPSQEIVVVNDGSTDATAERVIEAFDMRPIEADLPIGLPCAPVRDVYVSPRRQVVLIDKENGGKADALNAGVFFTEEPLFCAIDADSLIERGALRTVVEPFLTDPVRTIAAGGAVRLANGTSFRKGMPHDVDLPGNRLVRFQAVEYLRAFLLGRIGLSRLNSLLIISGAFGLFRTEIVRRVGGYDTDSITEDMELIVRLHRYRVEADRDYRVTFLPKPVVWTEAPERLSVLSRQRRRWYRGLLDTLVKHRAVIGRPSYGAVGIFALPFFLVTEGIGPLFEGLGYVLIPALFVIGLIGHVFFGSFLLVAVGLSVILTGLAVYGEVITYRRYEDPRDAAVLLWYGVLECFLYRPWRAFVSWRGLVEYLTGNRAWGEMTREGFTYEEE